MERGARESVFDQKLLMIFDKAKAFFSFAVEKIVTGKKKNIDDIRETANELQSKYAARVNFRIPEEFLRGGEIVFHDTVLEQTLDSFEHLPLEQASEKLDKILADKLSRGNIETLQDLIVEAENYNAVALNDMITRVSHLTQGVSDQAIADIIAGPGSKAEKIEQVGKLITTQGVTYLKDQGGKRWTIERYAQTLVRTETQKAYNYGIIHKGLEYGYTTFKRFERSDSCPLCAPHRGEIWDVSVQGLPDWGYHPNCRGNWEVYS